MAWADTVMIVKIINLATGKRTSFKWSAHHPENWSASCVQEWASFTSSKYGFPPEIESKVLTTLNEYTGKMLTSMTLEDFRNHFNEMGELIYVTFQQILDVAPDYRDRTHVYTSKISHLLQCMNDQTTSKQLSWKLMELSSWSCVEVFDWMTAMATEMDMTSHDRHMIFSQFCRLTGNDLYHKTLDEYKQINDQFGEALYLSVQRYKSADRSPGDRKRHRSSGDLTSIPEDT
ncbi:hypothetical protein ACF0H5_015562 [Mactra antiquata]